MINNYIKIAWRNLWRNKTFTLLNIIGLSVAFGVAILLAMTAFFDLSYDKFHENGKDIYLVYEHEQTPEGAAIGVSKPVPFASALKAEVPGIAKITRYKTDNSLVIYEGKELAMETAFLDNDFFSMFSFPIIRGNAKKPLESTASVVITQKAADKLFGNKNAIGKALVVLVNGSKKNVVVSSVLEDFPEQSSLDFELAVNFKNSPDYAENIDQWDNSNHEVYLQLQKGLSAEEFENKTQNFTAQHFADDIEDAKRDGAQPDAEGRYKSLHLLPFEAVHFANFQGGTVEVSKTYPYLILGIALLILFIANANFINMSIAKSTQRLREIGMRKTLGATKSQLFFQFWLESAFVFLCSLCLGILLSNILLDGFKSLFNTEASFVNVASPVIVAGVLLFFMCITFIAGGYPALLLSKLQTVKALKGKLKIAGKNRLRDGLMMVQFGIAIVLISGTLVLFEQLRFMRNKDLGFNKEQVIAFPLNGKSDNFMQLFRNELRDRPGILSITAADDVLGKGKDGRVSTSQWGFDYKGHQVETNLLTVDYDYVESLDLKLLAGRSFSRKFATDKHAVLINEAMVKELQEESPLNVQIEDDTLYSVIGVLKDYNFQRLDKKIEPITIFLSKEPNQLDYAYVKVVPQNLASSFELVKDAWEQIEPNVAFMGSFLDENINRTFQHEKTLTTIISSGSIIAIVLSCIGLFAISLLVVSQRTKEIGVRKVLGASVSGITFLLMKDFLKLVAIAFLITAPLAYWLLNNWLQDYAYRIDLNAWFFAAAGLFAVSIALATMSVKTINAALMNPVKALKTE